MKAMLKTHLDHNTSYAPLTPPPEAHSRILFFSNRKGKPFYLGELADDIGWSLERTEGYLEHMVDQGVIRKATADEIRHMSGTSHAKAYCVVGQTQAQLYHTP